MKKHIYSISSILIPVLALTCITPYAGEIPDEPGMPAAAEYTLPDGVIGGDPESTLEDPSWSGETEDGFPADTFESPDPADDPEDLFYPEEAFFEDPEDLEITLEDEEFSNDMLLEDDDPEVTEILFDDIEDVTETADPDPDDSEDPEGLFEETAFEEPVALASGITVNAEEITLYYLSGNYPNYISSIPDGLPTSFQIEVSGTDKTPTFARTGSGIRVDENGLITLASESNIYHESPGTVKVKIDGELVAKITVHQVSYESYYAEQKVNADMERLGIMNLAGNYDKVKAICEYISTTYNYSGYYASMTGEVITGGADCWGNSALVSYMCGQCGIPAYIRNANFEPGAGAGHENNIVKIDEDYYIVDCGYTGTAPRHYDFYKAGSDFEYFVNSDGTAKLVSDMRFDSDVITIPATINGYKVSSIRTGMLQERSYSKILVEEGSEYFSSKNGALCSADGKTLIACPRKKAGSYTIADGIETVGQYAFTYCSDITEITMPGSLTAIEDYAFEWCESLSKVNWSDSLTSIGERGFVACASLKEIILPESLRTIGDGAFCASMQPKFVVIPSGVTHIGAGAFLNVPFMVVRARDPELGDGAISQCRLFCHPGSTVDTVCGGTHFDIGMLDNDNKLILKKDFFTVDQSDRTYTGAELTTSVQNTDDYAWLRVYDWTWSDDLDRYQYGIITDYYDVTYLDNVDVGTATVRISGKGRCSGTISYTFKINPATVFSSDYYDNRMVFKDTGRRSATYQYTGEAITPEIAISRYGETVTDYILGRDYTLTYSDNTNIGRDTGTVTLNGIGNYAGTDTIRFTIKGDLPEPDAIPDQQYTGNYVSPKVSIPGLTQGTDFYVSYSNNYRPGQATVTVTGTGCYEGSRTLHFSIYRELPAIAYTISDQKYTGSEITPYVYIPGATQGTDYTLTYTDNINIGTATVTATGIGYYTGTRTTTFNITSTGSTYPYGNGYYWNTTDDDDDGNSGYGNNGYGNNGRNGYGNNGSNGYGDNDNDGDDRPAATIKLNAYSIPLKVGQSTDKIKVSGLQEGDFIRSWSSDNEKIVQVSPDGVIKALKKTGTANVTVTTAYGAAASVKVKVQKKKVAAKKISVKKKITLRKGEKYALNALVKPITVTDKIKYKSANKKTAAVSGKGVITAKAKGKTSITVKCGKKKVKIKITVN